MLDDLLQAVLDRPDDDAPRLAYADALGDDPRAEFIRLQLARPSRLGGYTPRQMELFREHRLEWLGDLAGVVRGMSFRRGFLEVVHMDAQVFLANPSEVFSAVPVRELGLELAANCASLFRLPELTRLHALTLTGGVTDDDARALAACPYLSGLIRLDLGHNAITRVGLEAIAGSPNLASLRGLDLTANPVPDPRPTPLGERPDTIWQKSELHRELVERYGPLRWLIREDEGGLPPLWAL